jgi:hypothetical protein
MNSNTRVPNREMENKTTPFETILTIVAFPFMIIFYLLFYCSDQIRFPFWVGAVRFSFYFWLMGGAGAKEEANVLMTSIENFVGYLFSLPYHIYDILPSTHLFSNETVFGLIIRLILLVPLFLSFALLIAGMAYWFISAFFSLLYMSMMFSSQSLIKYRMNDNSRDINPHAYTGYNNIDRALQYREGVLSNMSNSEKADELRKYGTFSGIDQNAPQNSATRRGLDYLNGILGNMSNSEKIDYLKGGDPNHVKKK